ncbi:MAG: FG-GAP repeat protein [Thermoanaerobaculia bacterium]
MRSRHSDSDASPLLVFCLMVAVGSGVAISAPAPAAAQLGLFADQFWTGDSPGLDTAAEDGGRFGSATAAGDFNGDGFDDLAIGTPGRTVGADGVAGEVVMLYGSPSGLTIAGHQIWTEDSAGIGGAAEPDDAFGTSLASGDFDHDGFDDLAIGVPHEGLAGLLNCGVVYVLPGSAAGLTATGSQVWSQDSAGIASSAAADDLFGLALAVGDFDEDGFADLAIGAPGEDGTGMPAIADIGAVHVLFGGATGISATDSRFYQPGDVTLGTLLPGAGIAFGGALAAGPLLSTGQDQIAIGAPRFATSGQSGSGAVVILANPRMGGSAVGVLTQDLAGVPGVAEVGDNFGAALAIGRFDDSLQAGLAVGSPGEDIESLSAANAGVVHLFRNLFTVDAVTTIWQQEDLPLLASETGDNFGAALGVGDFNADGRDDLVIGTPGESAGTNAGFGGGAILYGNAVAGLSAAAAQLLPLGVVVAFPDLAYGAAFAAGHFSGHSGSDLAFAAPRMDLPLKMAREDEAPVEEGSPLANAGAVIVFASIDLFRDGFESSGTGAWSQTGP